MRVRTMNRSKDEADKPAITRAGRKNRKKLSSEEIETIFARFQALNPEPATELVHTNSFTLLVAVVLSAQATDAGVNKATKPLFQKVKTPAAMAKFGEAALSDAIKTIGLYRTKAKNV
ncbi:MAG: endonuclease III, partial [Hyphomicrobiales bacterium]|nr:endonuclease III [Hyphomicrobiales bacterium]